MSAVTARPARRRWLRALGAAAAAACLLALWAFWLEPASLRVATYRLRLPHWPAQCSGVTVAAISDLHVGSPFNGVGKLERVVALTRRSHPDLVLLGGDYVIDNVLGGRFVSPEVSAEKLAEIDAPLGVLAVLGNHDWWLGGARVRTALEANDIPVLEDRAVQVRRGECAFWVAGVGDFWEGRHDIAAALENVPPGAPVIVLTHNPDIFPEIPELVSLTVAGHTHGGQVRIPFVGRPIVPSHYGERYAIGSIAEHGRQLFVTPGVGTSVLPVRFLVPPEISLLVLDAAP